MRARHALSSAALCICTAFLVAADNPRTTQLSWLTGEWKSVRKSAVVVEKWSAAGNSLINVGYTVNGDSLLDYETVIIRPHGTRLAYEAHPMGQETATFLSKTLTASSVVFENLEHDFPQRVAYELVNDDSLLAWIEGPGNDGKTKRIQFPYRRVK